jgi:hypothetical protein
MMNKFLIDVSEIEVSYQEILTKISAKPINIEHFI